MRSQALRAFQDVLGADAAEVLRKPDGTNNAKNARIHSATYQTLGIDTEDGDAPVRHSPEGDAGSFLATFYPEIYYTHVVIDECHRSAWGKWSQVLTRNAAAAQIGLTATPRCLKCSEKTKEAEADAEITTSTTCWPRSVGACARAPAATAHSPSPTSTKIGLLIFA